MAEASPERQGPGTGEGPAADARPRKSQTAFRTISEVSDVLDVPQHVLRFWETKFSQIRPMKRGGGRRYYRPEDVELLRRIRALLYDQGYTIKGVQKLLREVGLRAVLDAEPGARQATADPAPPPPQGNGLDAARRAELAALRDELRALARQLRAAAAPGAGRA